MRTIIGSAAAATVTVLAISLAVAQTYEKPPKMPKVDLVLQHLDKADVVTSDWGVIRWLMNSKIDHGADQTFGIVEIHPGQHNALHAHPNCEEILFVLSGSAELLVGDKQVVGHPGDLIRVPIGVPHQAFVIGNEPLRAVISYSSGDRKVINYGNAKE